MRERERERERERVCERERVWERERQTDRQAERKRLYQVGHFANNPVVTMYRMYKPIKLFIHSISLENIVLKTEILLVRLNSSFLKNLGQLYTHKYPDLSFKGLNSFKGSF